MRIIGGRWRRRMLSFPALEDLRPTPDRVRETVFNWLGQDMDGLACLDLFAGSGALGFEAASRGARRVVMVEQDARAVHALEANRDALGALASGSQIEILRTDALGFLQRSVARDPAGFDVVFLDPPFRLGLLPALLPAVAACLAPNGWVYVESSAGAPGDGDESRVSESRVSESRVSESWVSESWVTLRQARTGAVDYRLLARAPGAQAIDNPDTLHSDCSTAQDRAR